MKNTNQLTKTKYVKREVRNYLNNDSLLGKGQIENSFSLFGDIILKNNQNDKCYQQFFPFLSQKDIKSLGALCSSVR
jgi:hypothetical protein